MYAPGAIFEFDRDEKFVTIRAPPPPPPPKRYFGAKVHRPAPVVKNDDATSKRK